MAVYEIAPHRGAVAPLAHPVELICFALIVAHAVYLAASYWQGSFLTTELASWSAFGTDSWQAFAGNIGHTSQVFLSDGWADFAKSQTVFSFVRTLGLGEKLAWSDAAILVAALIVGRALNPQAAVA
jgi:hypothetical protein